MKKVNLVIPIEVPENLEDEEAFIKEFLAKLVIMRANGRDRDFMVWPIDRRIDDDTTITYRPKLHLLEWEYLGEQND